jgi:hypothetical protein
MNKIKSCLLASLLLSGISSAQAATTYYTSQSAFLGALGAAASTTYNFDGMTGGDIIASGDTLGDLSFSYGMPGVQIMVDNFFDTTSPANYLGTTDGSGAFLGGDGFTISFNQSMQAIGLYVISADLILDNDFTITTSSGLSFGNNAIADIFLLDGDAYYIGLIADAGDSFNSITFGSASANFLFNVDDITVSAVPVPAALWLMASGLLCLTGLGKRTKL